MDLLEFARGPALQWAAYILVAGTIWRIVGIVLLKEKADFSEPRAGGGLGAALKVIYTRSFTAEPFSFTVNLVSAVYSGHVLAPLRSNTMPVVPRVMKTRNACPSLPKGNQIINSTTDRM